MKSVKIFTNRQSQAVRLPKEYRFKEDEVFIKKLNDMVVLIPKNSNSVWNTLFDALNDFTSSLENLVDILKEQYKTNPSE